MIGWLMIRDEWRAGLRNRLNVDRGHRDGGELHLRRRRVGQRDGSERFGCIVGCSDGGWLRRERYRY